jgi:ABC-2 type transport system ATP-binding protein
LSGRDNVYLNGSILGLSRKEIDSKFDTIVAFAGLERFIDTPVKNYSSGMYVRLGFSVAINVDPDVLLVDEILAVGDENFQRKCAEKFAEMREDGKTIVVVSHALATVRTLCDQVALLDHGKLLRVGPSSEVIDDYIATTHTDAVDDGTGGKRWGSGEGRVTRVELIDGDGQTVRVGVTGDPLVLRHHYETTEPIEKPVFGMSISTINGQVVAASTTREIGLVPDKIDGIGYIDMVIDHLPLLPGTYEIATSLYDFTVSHPYDYRPHALRLDVEHGSGSARQGLIALDGTWMLHDGNEG